MLGLEVNNERVISGQVVVFRLSDLRAFRGLVLFLSYRGASDVATVPRELFTSNRSHGNRKPSVFTGYQTLGIQIWSP